MADDEALKIRYMKHFRDRITEFLDELIEQFPEEADFVIIRIFIKDQLSVSDVIGRYIRDVLPLKQQIHDRKESFFLENDVIYSSAAGSRVNHFKKLWKSEKLDSNDRNAVWNWMNLFTKIADTYFQKFGYIPSWEPLTSCENEE